MSGDVVIEVKNISKTLSKLEDRELSGIVSLMDPAILEQLYLEGTDRERKSFLAALPSERAARLVSDLVRPAARQDDFDPETSPPDSTEAGNETTRSAPSNNSSSG